MITILILTKPDDLHAIYVKLALEKMGHHADIWYTSDFPTQQTHSFYVKNNDLTWQTDVIANSLKNKYDIVWNRRPSKPILSDQLHPDDVEISRKENISFLQSIWQTILPDAIWINPPNSITRANSKLLQLKLAAKLGFNIPKTLISNNPDHIRQFISENKSNVIYKTLYPAAWLGKDELRLTYTSMIAAHDLPSDTLLQSTPGIFQQKIDKAYELRITYFGNRYVAVKIKSQQHPDAALDWRKAPTLELHLEQVLIPDEIDQLCRKLMKKLNIIFGCFDFIVTKKNRYFFLEVNEQGQFLWIEDVNPDIKMLEAFVKFVISLGKHEKLFSSPICINDLKYDAIHMKAEALKHHKNPPVF